MKPSFVLCFLALCLTCTAARAGIGMLPQDKAPVLIAETERNPFGKRIKVTKNNEETEESKIRALIESLPVVGGTGTPVSGKALLGSVMIEEGKDVPQVLENQTERLRVLEVRNGIVVLGFVEKSGTTESRKITLKAKMKPEVRFRLPTAAQAAAPKEDTSTLEAPQPGDGSETPKQ